MTLSSGQRWAVAAIAGGAALAAALWRRADPPASRGSEVAAPTAGSASRRRGPEEAAGSRASTEELRSGAAEPDEQDDDEGAPAQPPRVEPAPGAPPPAPSKRGSLLDTSDPCEPLVEPDVASELERVTAASVTIAWPQDVPVSETTSLAYTIAGLLREAALLTGTPPRQRLTVFLHGSRDALHLATGTPEWVSGVYDGAVHLVADPGRDFGVSISTLRHEVMHAQLHAGVGCMPAWFNEGVAQYFSGRPPVQTWMSMLKNREELDFDGLGVPTIVEAPKEDASRLYAQSLAMLLYTLDRAGEGALPDVVHDLHEIENADPRRRARLLWRARHPSTTSAEVRAALGQRMFGVASERDLQQLLAGPVCCAGDQRIAELSCRAAPEGNAPRSRCRPY